jgi:hypothetical protein
MSEAPRILSFHCFAVLHQVPFSAHSSITLSNCYPTMSLRDQRGVEEAFDTQLDSRLSQPTGVGNQPSSHESESPPSESPVPVGRSTGLIPENAPRSGEIIETKSSRQEPGPSRGDVPVIRHVDQGERMLTIASFRQSTNTVSYQSLLTSHTLIMCQLLHSSTEVHVPTLNPQDCISCHDLRHSQLSKLNPIAVYKA